LKPLVNKIGTRAKREEAAGARRRSSRAEVITGWSDWNQDKRIVHNGSMRRRGRTGNRSRIGRRVTGSVKGRATGDVQTITDRTNVGHTILGVLDKLCRRGMWVRKDTRGKKTKIIENNSPNSGEVDTRHGGWSRDPDWAHHLWSR
jgi:hypothetical protein